MTKVRWILGVLACFVATTCADTGAFLCESDDQCAATGGAGACVDGFCAFPDTGCDSGLRYGEHAPGNLPNTCVPPPTGGSSDDGVGPGPGSEATGPGSGPTASSVGDGTGPLLSDSGSTTSEIGGSGSVGDTSSSTDGGAGWWDAAFSSRIEIRVDPRLTAADLVDFPLLVAWPANADLAGATESDGADLRFVADEEGLDHEIEVFEPSTGELAAWVRVPALSSTRTGVLHLYYGNPAAVPPDPAAVWDADFGGVWHLGTAADSTAHENDGEATATASTPGRIGPAQHFDGSTSQIVVPDGPSLAPPDAHTISAWVRAEAFASDVAPILARATQASSQPSGAAFFLRLGDAYLDYTVHTDAGPQNTFWAGYGQAWLAQWHHVAAVWDGGMLTIYTDGEVATSVPSDGLALLGAHPVSMGSWATGTPVNLATRTLLGDLDEVRLSGVARAPAWIGASFRNQGDPSAYLEVDPAQAAP